MATIERMLKMGKEDHGVIFRKRYLEEENWGVLASSIRILLKDLGLEDYDVEVFVSDLQEDGADWVNILAMKAAQ